MLNCLDTFVFYRFKNNKQNTHRLQVPKKSNLKSSKTKDTESIVRPKLNEKFEIQGSTILDFIQTPHLPLVEFNQIVDEVEIIALRSTSPGRFEPMSKKLSVKFADNVKIPERTLSEDFKVEGNNDPRVKPSRQKSFTKMGQSASNKVSESQEEEEESFKSDSDSLT